MLNDLETGWRVTPLDPGVVVTVRPPPASAPRDDRVEAIWAQACADRPSLFDGRVFVAEQLSATCIDGYWTRYRHLYAQLRHPELFSPPHLRALAVNGLLSCPDGVVLGRRRADAVYRPGSWQTVPAGSVEARDGDDTVCIERQLGAELLEEIGLRPDETGPIVPMLAIEHPGGHVLDIGCRMWTDLPFAAIERRWRDTANTEYDALRVVHRDRVPRFVRESGPDLLASARLLLGC